MNENAKTGSSDSAGEIDSGKIDPAKMSVGAILHLLNLGQIASVIAFFLTAIGAAAGGGWWFASYAADVGDKKQEVVVAQLEGQIETIKNRHANEMKDRNQEILDLKRELDADLATGETSAEHPVYIEVRKLIGQLSSDDSDDVTKAASELSAAAFRVEGTENEDLVRWASPTLARILSDAQQPSVVRQTAAAAIRAIEARATNGHPLTSLRATFAGQVQYSATKTVGHDFRLGLNVAMALAELEGENLPHEQLRKSLPYFLAGLSGEEHSLRPGWQAELVSTLSKLVPLLKQKSALEDAVKAQAKEVQRRYEGISKSEEQESLIREIELLLNVFDTVAESKAVDPSALRIRIDGLRLMSDYRIIPGRSGHVLVKNNGQWSLRSARGENRGLPSILGATYEADLVHIPGNGDAVALACGDNKARLWQPSHEPRVYPHDDGTGGNVYCLDVHTEKNWIVTGGRGKAILWTLKGEKLAELPTESNSNVHGDLIWSDGYG